jgi:nucleotide-binding universal stress UspA family protein
MADQPLAVHEKGTTMIGTVILPLDGSNLAERAIPYAEAVAERSGAPLLLVHAAKIGATTAETAEARDYLRSIGSKLPGRVQMELLPGDPAETIITIAGEVPDPAIVMSTHGRSGVRRWVTGSVADQVVRTAGHPVLLVRAGQEVPEELGLHSILLPLDGTTSAETAIGYAAELARMFESQIHVVRVVDTPSAYAMLSRHMEAAVTGDILDEIIQSMLREATEYVEKVATDLRQQGIRVKSVVLEGYPGEQLVEYERREFFQLVVMATAGRSGVSRIVFGSVAERMLKLGRRPVMMIRPEHVEESDEAEQEIIAHYP